MRNLGRALVPTLVVLACLGSLAGPALAQSATEAEVCGVDDTTLVPGQTITVTGSGYPPGSEVTITLSPGGIELGTATADDQGNFSETFVIPADLEPGAYTIACSRVGGETIGNDVTIVGAAVGGTAFTGSSLNVPLWTLLIAVLLGTGLVLVLAGRRRQRKHAGSRS
jgi:hypothetical protein